MNGNEEQGSFFKARPERPAAHGICPMIGPGSILVIASIGSFDPPQVGCTVECVVGILRNINGILLHFGAYAGVRGHDPKQSNIESNSQFASTCGTWGTFVTGGKRLAGLAL